MPGSGIGDCELEKFAFDEEVPSPPVTKEQLNAAAVDIQQKYDRTMSNKNLSPEVRGSHTE